MYIYIFIFIFIFSYLHVSIYIYIYTYIHMCGLLNDFRLPNEHAHHHRLEGMISVGSQLSTSKVRYMNFPRSCSLFVDGTSNYCTIPDSVENPELNGGFQLGKASINGELSIAMLGYQRVAAVSDQFISPKGSSSMSVLSDYLYIYS